MYSLGQGKNSVGHANPARNANRTRIGSCNDRPTFLCLSRMAASHRRDAAARSEALFGNSSELAGKVPEKIGSIVSDRKLLGDFSVAYAMSDRPDAGRLAATVRIQRE